MKAALCLAVLCSIAALTFGEQCRLSKDCTHVTCPENDYTLDCVQHQCTCTHATATCVSQKDCTSSDDNCRFTWHCVDSKCRCGYGIPNLGGLGK